MNAALFMALGLLASAPEPSAALAEAEALALRGEADAALELYGALLEDGTDFAALRYNLGTLFLERGELGPAVLHLRAALRHDPRLEDARYNLARALEARADRVEGAAARTPSWTDAGASLRSSEAALAFAIALVLFFLTLALWPFTPPASGVRRLCGVALAPLGLALAGAALVLAARVHIDGAPEAVVLDEEVAARVGPSLDAAVRFTAHPGLYGAIVEEEGGWVRLRLENGLDAWLPRGSVGTLGNAP